MITKLVNRLIITTVLFSINLIAYGEVIKLEERLGLNGRYYENGGCIYFIGDFTEGELLIEQQKYEKRVSKLSKQFELERQRRHEFAIETIKAQTIRDYLIAQNIPLREIADAIRKIKIEQNITIGDIISSSYSKIDNINSKSISSSTSKGGSSLTFLTNSNTNKNINDNTNDIDVKK